MLLLFPGAMPAERRMPHSFPNKPAVANKVTDSISLCSSSQRPVYCGSGRYFLSIGFTGVQTHYQNKVFIRPQWRWA